MQKPICSICYEDLKPITEDLQSIPICGHVFHELCLQQWLEYCPANKKPTCPVCKQSFSNKLPTRLFFQSTGDSTQLNTQNTSSFDAEAMAEQVARMELKVKSLTTKLELQDVTVTKLNGEVDNWREKARREESKREEIKKEKELVEGFLRVKLEELSRKSSECAKLEERSLGLAKELAAIKLATDFNLLEDEMVKLASLGHGSNHANAVEVLKRSLALRNKSYKELMVQCNVLGRSESRTRQDLDKAKEKITKLKSRLQELAIAFEEKENRILREIKASKRHKAAGLFTDSLKQNSEVCRSYTSEECQMEKTSAVACHKTDLSTDDIYTFKRSLVCPEVKNINVASLNMVKNHNTSELDNDAGLVNDDLHDHFQNACKHPGSHLHGKSNSDLIGNAETNNFIWNARESLSSPKIGLCSMDNQTSFVNKTLVSGTNNNNPNNQKNAYVKPTASSWKQEILLIDDITKTTPLARTKESQSHDTFEVTDDPCSSGAFCLESANKTAGKWHSRFPTARSSLSVQASKNSGDLIAVGADGRGGKIKVLRTCERLSASTTKTNLSKKQKIGASKSGQAQIEHFFGKPKA